jgi:hypothetical protein
MSIWGSEAVAGEAEDGEFDGSVVSYISGWSNHYPGHFPGPFNFEDKTPGRRSPANDLTEETPASVGTGWLSPWCVPGQDEDEVDEDALGPWLRLDVMMRTVSIWAGVEIGHQDVHSVCLNESAVEALRDNLNAWLEREKVYPKPTAGLSAGQEPTR